MSESKPGIYAMRDPRDVRYIRGVMRTGTNVPVSHDDIATAYCRHLINTRQLIFVMDAPVDRKSVSLPKAEPTRTDDERTAAKKLGK